MSNLPPGVTGNELEIAGPDWEGEIHRSCDNTDASVITVHPDLVSRIETYKTAQRDDIRQRAEVSIMNIIRWYSPINYEEIGDCPWEGDVSAWAYGGVLHWTCPICRYDHEEIENEYGEW